jgi:hypothetical protein
MWKLHEYICLVEYFHKSIHILVFNKSFYKNKKSKLYFEERVVILNGLFYGYGESNYKSNCMSISFFSRRIL